MRKTTYSLFKILILTMTLNIGCNGGSQFSGDCNLSAFDKQLTEFRAKLVEISANLSCNADSDCQSMAIGHKSCGGPEFYQRFSQGNVNQEELDRWANIFLKTQEDFNNSCEISSTCISVNRPQLACISSVCADVGGFE